MRKSHAKTGQVFLILSLSLTILVYYNESSLLQLFGNKLFGNKLNYFPKLDLFCLWLKLLSDLLDIISGLKLLSYFLPCPIEKGEW